MTRIIQSRNKREGLYAGWRVTAGRHSLNWSGRQVNHERTGGTYYGKADSLRERIPPGDYYGDPLGGGWGCA